ncbi:MAG: DMT family transporter [candidate division WOR-3 bacterium]|nr:DMT family transporter [candidate division WOR-3 bacterium]
MDNQKKAYLFAFIVILFWSTVASAFKITLRFLNYIQLVFWASFFSMIVLFLILLFENRFKKFLRYFKIYWTHHLILGILNPFVYYLVLFKAYSLLPAQQAQPLNQTWAILLTFLSALFLKQKTGWKDFLALFISFTGVLIISTQGRLSDLKFSNPGGVLLALGSAFVWAFYWILNLHGLKEPIVELFSNFIFGVAFIFAFMLISGQDFFPNLYGIIGGLYIGIFEMGIAFYFWLKALSLSRTTARISILVYLIPFLSLIFIRLTVGEKILWSTVAGLFFIILGILIQQYHLIKLTKENK